jgi:hypothetical protein
MRNGLADVALRNHHGAQSTASLGVVGNSCQDLPVGTLGFGECACLMVRDGRPEQDSGFVDRRAAGRYTSDWRDAGPLSGSPFFPVHGDDRPLIDGLMKSLSLLSDRWGRVNALAPRSVPTPRLYGFRVASVGGPA